jgi:MSHA biogenesis protein MshG
MATTFEYRARDAHGGERAGTLGGASSAAVARELSGMGLVPLVIRPLAGRQAAAAAGSAAQGPAMGGTGAGAAAGSAGAAIGPAAWLARLRRPSAKRLQQGLGLVMRELASLLRAGVPLMRALQLTADSSADEPVRAALQRITRDLDNGHNLVAAAEHEHRASGLITPYDIAMLQVGEQTGRLPEAFADLYRQREFTAATNEQVGAALRYPAFVILTCLMALVVVNLWVIPAFAKVFAQARAELPLLTQLLLATSNGMIKGWPLMLVTVVGGTWGWKRWLASPRGHLWWDRRKLRLPIIGRILEGIVLSRLASSLSSSISAGLTISDALSVTARTLGNRWFQLRLEQMCHDLARGSSITASARHMGVLPPTMLQMFAIGEESGSLEELMREIASHYQSEVDYAIKRLSATLEPILIWFLGICVLVLALGIFMPMWDLGRATAR